MVDAPLIQLDTVCKSFGGVKAVDRVSLAIRRGEIHAVVGENGAGKSTLMKLLCGVHTPDAGEIRLDGVATHLRSPLDAQRQGVSIVFQELNLLPHRSVAANIFAGREWTGRLGLIEKRAMHAAAGQVLRTLDLDIEPATKVGSLSLAEQQLVEIARTLQQDARIIILDEPNSALNAAESQRLFEIVRRLRSQGRTIIYISHRLEEVFAIADRITVMRDGQWQATFRTAETSTAEVIATMIGRSIDHTFPQRLRPPANAPVVLNVRDLRFASHLAPISFEVRAGEILGFAGLEGAGVDELFRALFGLQPTHGGEIQFHQRPVQLGSPRQAMRLKWGLIPASRRDQGLCMDWSIARNTTLLVLKKLLSHVGLIHKSAVRSTTAAFMDRLNITAHGSEQTVSSLSGGNQQKVLLAKWLATDPQLLILNDPTRGVDVGAKREIYELCRQLAGEGVAILLTSSEFEEVLGLADRVLVLHKTRPLQDFDGRAATKAQLMHAISGGIQNP